MADNTLVQLEEIETFDRKTLQELCKTRGIKANMKTEDMRIAINQHDGGGVRNPIYYRKGWFVENKKKVVAGGSALGLILLALLIYFIVQSGSPSVESPMANYPVAWGI